MVLVSVSLVLMYYTRTALWLLGVMSMMASVIKASPLLAPLILLMLIVAGLTAVIPNVVNPSHPPFRVVLLFRQVRARLGLPKTVNNIRRSSESFAKRFRVISTLAAIRKG